MRRFLRVFFCFFFQRRKIRKLRNKKREPGYEFAQTVEYLITFSMAAIEAIYMTCVYSICNQNILLWRERMEDLFNKQHKR